jgi:hypothetical protein
LPPGTTICVAWNSMCSLFLVSGTKLIQILDDSLRQTMKMRCGFWQLQCLGRLQSTTFSAVTVKLGPRCRNARRMLWRVQRAGSLFPECPGQRVIFLEFPGQRVSVGICVGLPPSASGISRGGMPSAQGLSLYVKPSRSGPFGK